LKYIGSGGMAKVYLAVHKDVPNLKVVLKILSHSEHTDRFKQEADKLALLDNNPNICKIRHFFNHVDEFVIAMDYIDGPSLEEILDKKEETSVPDTLKMIVNIITALEPAHTKGIFHRDIKPSNIMFTKTGDLKIIDFGIAKGKSDPQLTIVGTAAGTPEYMAPEQFAAQEDLDYSKCDLYTIGTMLYKMLTGELPHKGANEFILRDAKLFDTPVRPSKLNKNINKELDNIIIKSIKSNPDERFNSLTEMKTEIQSILDNIKGISPKSSLPKTSSVKPSGGGLPKVIKLTSVLVAIGAVAFIGYKTIPRGGDSTSQVINNNPVEQVDNLVINQESTRTSPNTVQRAEPPPTTISHSSPPVPAPTPVLPPGELVVGSRPRGGSIYINGKLQKEPTPFTFSLPPGRYTVKIVLPSGEEYVETVTVRSDQRKNILYKPES